MSTSIYSACMEIASEEASPRSRGAVMIQNKTLKTKKPEVLLCRVVEHQGLPFLVFVQLQCPITCLKENYLCLYNPTSFSCNPRDSEKRGVVLDKTKVFRLQSIF